MPAPALLSLLGLAHATVGGPAEVRVLGLGGPPTPGVTAVVQRARRDGPVGQRLVDPADPASELVAVCQPADVVLRWAGQEAHLHLSGWGGVAVVGAWALPGRPERLVMLRHVGVTFESGYTADVPVLLAPIR